VVAISVSFGTLARAQSTAPALTTPRVAFSSPISALTVNTIYGQVHYGADFGLPMTANDFTIFDSPQTATQATIGGQADILNASLVSTLVLREAGKDFKVFCPNAGKVDYVVVGRNGIKTLEQVADPKTRVGIDGPTNVSSTILNALFAAHNIKATVADLPNKTILEVPTARQAAWVDNQFDVTLMRLSQFRQSQASVSDGVIIAKLYEELPEYMFTGYVADSAWLDKNLDVAAAFCASALKAGYVLENDYDKYIAAVHEFVAKPPSDDILKESFSLIAKYDFWQVKSGATASAITYMGTIAQKGGTLKAVPDAKDVLDTRAYEMALKMVPEVAALATATEAAPDATAAATAAK